MRQLRIVFTILAFSFIGIANAGVITIEGYYQGKNLFVQNPFKDNEFCVVSVFVNNSKVISYPKVSAFEVDLSSLAINTPITIKILHRNNCEPKLLNQQVVMSKSRFAFTSMNVDKDAVNWSSKGEKLGGKFYLQRLSVNNSWDTVEEVDCKGNLSASYYSWDAVHVAGLNQYRIKFVEEDGLIFYTKTVEIKNNREPITFYPRRVSDIITFVSKSPVVYSIYDKNGEIVMTGKGVTINCESLPQDDHYTLLYDNQKKTFYKK